MSGLTTTQAQILEALAGLDPPWVLFGGAALIGYVLHHRTTRDRDLSFRDRTQLGDAPLRVEERLRERGFVVSPCRPPLRSGACASSAAATWWCSTSWPSG